MPASRTIRRLNQIAQPALGSPRLGCYNGAMWGMVRSRSSGCNRSGGAGRSRRRGGATGGRSGAAAALALARLHRRTPVGGAARRTARPRLTSRFTSLFGGSPASTAAQRVGLADRPAGCRRWTATARAPRSAPAPRRWRSPPRTRNRPTASDVRYQLTITQLARQCMLAGPTIRMKVGVQGRVIVGPAGAPSQVEVPIRYARGPGGRRAQNHRDQVPASPGGHAARRNECRCSATSKRI